MDNQQIKSAVQGIGDALVQQNHPKGLGKTEQQLYRNMVDLVTNVLCNLNDLAHWANNDPSRS